MVDQSGTTDRASRRTVLNALAVAAGGVGMISAGACGPLPEAGGQQQQTKQPVTLRATWNATEAEHTFAAAHPVLPGEVPARQGGRSSSAGRRVSNQGGRPLLVQLHRRRDVPRGRRRGLLRLLDRAGRAQAARPVHRARQVRHERLLAQHGGGAQDRRRQDLVRSPTRRSWRATGSSTTPTRSRRAASPLPTDAWTYDDMRNAAQRLTKRSGTDVTFWGGGRNFGGRLLLHGGDPRLRRRPLLARRQEDPHRPASRSRQAITLVAGPLHQGPARSRSTRASPTRGMLFEQGKAAFITGYNPGDRRAVANALNPTGVQWGLP